MLRMTQKYDKKAVWSTKKELLKIWMGLNIYTLNRYLYEMRSNPKYRGFVINPTSKQVFIHLQGFEEFLRWKQCH